MCKVMKMLWPLNMQLASSATILATALLEDVAAAQPGLGCEILAGGISSWSMEPQVRLSPLIYSVSALLHALC